jgi:CheY-like chemotaxis protein
MMSRWCVGSQTGIGSARHVTARDGAEAVRAALTDRFEAIVLDVLMPKVDGLTALRQRRNDPQTSVVPVLLLSGSCPSTSRQAWRLARPST